MARLQVEQSAEIEKMTSACCRWILVFSLQSPFAMCDEEEVFIGCECGKNSDEMGGVDGVDTKGGEAKGLRAL